MKRLAKSLLLVLVLGFGALYPSAVWSKDCVDCSVQKSTTLSGCTDVGDCHPCGDIENDDFDEQVCVRAYDTDELAEIEDYYNRCRVERKITKYKSFSDFLAHGRCEGQVLDNSDFIPRDFITDKLKFNKFFIFYKDLIKKNYLESRNTGFDKIKDVMYMMNTPNDKGETLLDFMYRTWSGSDLDFLDNRIHSLHRMACMYGAKYNKYPDRNEDCKKRQDPRFMKI